MKNKIKQYASVCFEKINTEVMKGPALSISSDSGKITSYNFYSQITFGLNNEDDSPKNIQNIFPQFPLHSNTNSNSNSTNSLPITVISESPLVESFSCKYVNSIEFLIRRIEYFKIDGGKNYLCFFVLVDNNVNLFNGNNNNDNDNNNYDVNQMDINTKKRPKSWSPHQSHHVNN